MAVRLTSASSQSLSRATVPDYNAAYTALIAVRFETLIAGSDPVVLMLQSATLSDYDLLWYYPAGSQLRWNEYLADVPRDIVGPALTPGVWYYMAMVRYSATSRELFLGTSPLNMVSVGTDTGGNVAARAAATTVKIGEYSGNFFLNGRVRYARLFTTALTLPQIKAASGGTLWGAWLLPDATNLTDSSGNGRNLTATGTPTTEADDTVTWPTQQSQVIAPVSDVTVGGWRTETP